MVAIILCALLFPILAFFYTGHFSHETRIEKSSGPSHPFSDILDVAEKGAHSIDKDAVLSSVTIDPVGYLEGTSYTTPATESLEFTFRYLRPDGRDITLRLEDADPASTLDTSVDPSPGRDPGKQAYLRDRDDLPNYRALLNSYKLTPRDAVRQTWVDSSSYIIKQIVAKEHVVPDVWTGRSATGVPIWKVDYRYQPNILSGSQKGKLDFGFSVVSYVVNGETGEIISRKYETITPTPTPEPWASTH